MFLLNVLYSFYVMTFLLYTMSLIKKCLVLYSCYDNWMYLDFFPDLDVKDYPCWLYKTFCFNVMLTCTYGQTNVIGCSLFWNRLKKVFILPNTCLRSFFFKLLMLYKMFLCINKKYVLWQIIELFCCVNPTTLNTLHSVWRKGRTFKWSTRYKRFILCN